MSTNIDQLSRQAKKYKPANKLKVIEAEQIYGPKPVWTNIKNTDESFEHHFSKALNWAKAIFEDEELKQETIKYLIARNKDIGNLKEIPNYKFVVIGKLAWLYNEGCPLDDVKLHKLDSQIKLLQENKQSSAVFAEMQISPDNNKMFIKDVLETSSPPNKNQSQKKLFNKVKDIISDINTIIDNSIMEHKKLDDKEIYNRFVKEQYNNKITNQVHEQLTHQFHGFEIEKKSLERLGQETIQIQFDSEENYQKYVTNIKLNIEYLLNVINQIGSYLGDMHPLKKSERRGRKAKIKEPKILLDKLKYQKEDTELKIVSIDPNTIIGAQTLIIYHVRYRKLGIYVTADLKGFEIRGTTLYNYDENFSMQKIIKKPEILKEFQECTINRAAVVFNENIRAKKQPLNGRISDEVLLLRVFNEKFPSIASSTNDKN